MLTKDDLAHIRTIVREEVEAELEPTRNNLKAEIKLARMEITTSIADVEDRLKNLEVKANKLQKDMDGMKTDMKVVINSFDREYLKLQTRVAAIEDHLNLAAT